MQSEHLENHNADNDPPAADMAPRKREVSSIQFPYNDLDDAVAVARAIHEVGGQSCQWEQLAAYLKAVPTGGAFRFRLQQARIFGLMAYDKGTVSLCPLGQRILDPSQEAAAKADAFLNVPLYKAIFDRYKGYTLPPTAALERDMASLGVSSKQTDKARQAFDRSARQAGFYWAGADRLTLPVTKAKPDTRPAEQPPSSEEHGNGGAGTGGGNGYHPFIEGLLKTLPKTGDNWPVRDRAKWLKLAANAFDLIYEGDGGEIEIHTKTAANTAAA
jgi:hypothetical protein